MQTPTKKPRRVQFSVALKIALAYAIVGIVYVLISDQVVNLLAPNPEVATRWQSLKGWGYVLVTSLLLLVVLELYISRQKRIDQELRRSEAELSAIVDNAPFIIIIVDSERRIQKINHHGASFVGRPREELLGLRGGEALRCVHALDDPRGCGFGEACESCTVRNTVLETIETGRQHQSVEVEMTFDREGREERRNLLLYTNPITVSGERQVMVILQDVTERRRMEAQIQQQQRLATVGRLAAGIAHDFRNLLTTILLYAQMDRHRADVPPKVADDLEIIVGECDRATVLVQQILDFSSRAMIERESLDLGTFVPDVVNNVLRRTIPESIDLHVSTEPSEGDTPFVVHADPSRIHQVLLNLALNARDAMPAGGELRLSLSTLSLGPEQTPPVAAMPPGEYVRLSVSDTGTGMTNEVRDKAFEPFFTTKDVDKGTGLGLPQVYGIVRQHRGHIDVETELDRGTTFHIYLPRAEEPFQPRSEQAASYPPDGHGETVLVVEDAVQILEAVRDGLTSLGYRVLTAADGREALQTVANEAVDLVLTDVVMPQMGGEALLEELRAQAPHLPVIAMTGYVIDKDAEALKEMGFKSVIAKPFSIDDLAKVVRAALT